MKGVGDNSPLPLRHPPRTPANNSRSPHPPNPPPLLLLPKPRLLSPARPGLTCAPHPGVDTEVAVALQIGVPLVRFAAVLLGGVSRAHHGEVLLERGTVHVEGAGLQAVARGVHAGGLGVHGAAAGVEPGHGGGEGRRGSGPIPRSLGVGGESARSLLGEDSGWENRTCGLIFRK